MTPTRRKPTASKHRIAWVFASAGHSFWEAGPHAILVRNESHADVVVYVTFIAPTGAALRIDIPNPGLSSSTAASRSEERRRA